MRGCEALQRAQPASAMAVLPASAFGALCLCFVFVMQPGMATLVFHHKTGNWLNDGERLLGGERVLRASWRDGAQKPKVRRVGQHGLLTPARCGSSQLQRFRLEKDFL